MLQQGDQFLRRRRAEVGQLRLFETLGRDAINTPAVIAAVQIEMLLDRLRQ